MSEQIRNNEIQQSEISKFEKLKSSLNKLKNKESKFLFFVTQVNNPAASIYEIYFNATVVKNMGYSVTILTDSQDYEIPTWIEKELTDFEHQSIVESKLTVGPEDVLVIPEIFSNIMEQTKNLPSIRIVLLQSIDYMFNALLPATDWSTFGIKNVITTSNTLKNIVEQFLGVNKFFIDVYNPSIPDYFYNDNTPKRPVISLVGRNPNEVSKIIKLFYSKYPQYSWITFDSMITDSNPPSPLSRKDYANRLRKNFASVWIDRIASFGTFPLEAMKSGSIPIGIVPDIVPEYLLKGILNDSEEANEDDNQYIVNSGVWTKDLYALPILIGDVITKFLDDSIQDEVYKTMEKITSKYSSKNSIEQLQNIYQNVLNERINIFEKEISNFESSEKVISESK